MVEQRKNQFVGGSVLHSLGWPDVEERFWAGDVAQGPAQRRGPSSAAQGPNKQALCSPRCPRSRWSR
eukprot:11765476-Alexandrium_andersonii.AAC.1